MQRIATTNRSVDLFGAGKDGFRAGNIGAGIEATAFSNDWCNSVQEEIANVIEGQGIALDLGDRTQLRQAITKMIQSGNRTVVIDGVTFAPAVTTSGQVVYWDSANNRFDLAIADGTNKQNAVGVADLAASSVVAFGDATLFAGLTPGGRYYLSGTVAGALTTVLPAFGAVLIGVARSATEVFVDIDANPQAIGVQGAFKNLRLSASGTSALVSASFDELVLGDGAGTLVVERSVAETFNTTTVGAGGLDTGALAASAWYSIWRIGKLDGTRAWLFSLSATAPTMPVGYTLKARIGWFRTDGTGNKYPLSFQQLGRRVQYKVAGGSNVSGMPQMAAGLQGSITVPTWMTVNVGNFVPPTAVRVGVAMQVGAPNLAAAVAPNTSYGAFSSTTNPPPLGCGAPSAGANSIVAGDLLLESANIYIASSGTSYWFCTGWEDEV